MTDWVDCSRQYPSTQRDRCPWAISTRDHQASSVTEPAGPKSKPDLLLHVVADENERAVHAEGGLAEVVLQAEPAEVVAGAHRVGQREEGMLGQVAVVEHHALADAQLPGLLFHDRAVDPRMTEGVMWVSSSRWKSQVVSEMGEASRA